MGSYLIPGAKSTAEAAGFVPVVDGRYWEGESGGVRFTDPALSDSECAALYVGFTPSGATDDFYERPLSPAIASIVADFRQFLAAPNGSATNAQRDALIKDIIRALAFVNRRLA